MKKISKIIIYAFLVLITLITLLPVIYAFFGSFKNNQELLTSGANLIPKKFVFDNYVQAWNLADFKKYTWNSVYLTFFSVIGVVLTSSMGGYVFARGHFKGQKFWFGTFSMLMFVNFGSAVIIPQMNIVSSLGLMGSLWGLVFVNFFGINVVNFYLVRGFISGLHKELDEAATIDGCGFLGTFVYVIAPLLKPVVATIAMLGFQGTWNAYLMPMLYTMTNPSRGTLVSALFALRTSGNAAANWNIMLAGSVIASVPVIVIYILGNKHFMNNLTAGAVKG